MKNNTSFNLKIIAMIVAIFVIGFILSIALEGMKENKLKRERELIRYGGTMEEANKSIEKYNERLQLFHDKRDSVISENKEMYIYSNNQSITDGYLFPNIDYDVFNEYGYARPLIPRNEDITKELDNFLNNDDSLGYKVVIEKNDHSLLLKKYDRQYDTLIFKLVTYYIPTEHFLDKTKNLRLKKFDHLSPEKDELEIKNYQYYAGELGRLNDRIYVSDVFKPYSKQFFDDSFRFYFTSYNKNISLPEFKKYVDLFNEGFIKELDCSMCEITKIKVGSIRDE